MSTRIRQSPIILQDRKRLPVRFFADFCKTVNGRL
tara:strand:- start:172 stop:276 length:105 start_codon:yes stop_codon:yes gene_type:complete